MCLEGWSLLNTCKKESVMIREEESVKFYAVLCDIIGGMTAQEIMSYPEVVGILSEELNNEVLKRMEEEEGECDE